VGLPVSAGAENVHTLFVPDADAMRDHLDHLFGGYLDGMHDGLIELAWTDTKPGQDGRYSLRHAMMFGTDQIEELIAEAVRLNSQPMCNVYVGAALRRPGTFPGGRGNDGDVLALTCVYADFDDEGAATSAKDKYGGAKPTKIVVTGREPYTRAQMWWRLDEPITDSKQSEALLKGMATALGGDPTVTNPSRVMRLAGTIAWPVKPDRKRPEKTFIAVLREPGQPVYTVGHLLRLFPLFHGDAFEAAGIQFPQDDGVTRGANVFGLGDKVEDGRERYMVKTINACLIQLIGEVGHTPGAQELFDLAWPQYARETDFTRPGRGQAEFGRKVIYTLKRFAGGRIRGCETIEKVQAIYRVKQQAYRASGGSGKYHDYTGSDEFARGPRIDPETGEPLPLIQSSAQFVKDFQSPDYLIDGIIQKGRVYSLTARTHHGKTAVAMYLVARVARHLEISGRETAQGSVLFLAGENSDDIKARWLVLADHEKFDVNTIPVHFIDGVIDIRAELSRIAQEAVSIPNLVLVIVDTAAAYFMGDEDNSNTQKGGYARLLRELTKLPGKPAAIINCHPVKNAPQDNLLPVGGGAFVNEMDGNLTLWAEGGEKQTTLHWQGKFRGPEFEALTFELKIATSDRVKDSKGRHLPSIMAVPLPETVAAWQETVAEEDDKTVLRLIHTDKQASYSSMAERAGWKWPDGSPAKSKVQKIVRRLLEARLIVKFHRTKYRLTRKGCRVIKEKWDDEDSE
jgi:hypothetical protein